MIQTMSLPQLLAIAAYKAAETHKGKVSVIVKAPNLPPTPPYKTVKADSPYGEVRLRAVPTEQGDWKVIVRFKEFKEGFTIAEMTQKKS
jgi:hypothetical protein